MSMMLLVIQPSGFVIVMRNRRRSSILRCSFLASRLGAREQLAVALAAKYPPNRDRDKQGKVSRSVTSRRSRRDRPQFLDVYSLPANGICLSPLFVSVPG